MLKNIDQNSYEISKIKNSKIIENDVMKWNYDDVTKSQNDATK